MITIYGKTNCAFCVKAKAFAEQRGFEYEYKDVGARQSTFQELLERAPEPVRSVPQIWINDDYVGGYTQFVQYVEDTGYTGTGHSL